ncbi:hypothetical protein FKM82_029567 [Ascaphus truei]
MYFITGPPFCFCTCNSFFFSEETSRLIIVYLPFLRPACYKLFYTFFPYTFNYTHFLH